MQVKLLNITENMAEVLLPSHIQGLIAEPETYVFGVLNKDTLIGIAVLTVQSETSFVINHIGKNEDADDKVYYILLDEIERFSRDNGARSITSRIIDTPDSLIEVATALNAFGYLPVELNGHFLLYSMSDILKTEFFKLISERGIQKYFSRVVSYRNLSKQQLSDFVSLLKNSKYHTNIFRPDKKYSHYYILKEEVAGYMDVNIDKHAGIYIKDIFVSKSTSDKYILPVLMARVLAGVCDMFDNEGTVIISVYNHKVYSWIRAALGDSYKEQNIFEYVKLM